MAKKEVPLYLGNSWDPNRQLIGTAIVDDETLTAEVTITEPSAKRVLGDPPPMSIDQDGSAFIL